MLLSSAVTAVFESPVVITVALNAAQCFDHLKLLNCTHNWDRIPSGTISTYGGFPKTLVRATGKQRSGLLLAFHLNACMRGRTKLDR